MPPPPKSPDPPRAHTAAGCSRYTHKVAVHSEGSPPTLFLPRPPTPPRTRASAGRSGTDTHVQISRAHAAGTAPMPLLLAAHCAPALPRAATRTHTQVGQANSTRRRDCQKWPTLPLVATGVYVTLTHTTITLYLCMLTTRSSPTPTLPHAVSHAAVIDDTSRQRRPTSWPTPLPTPPFLLSCRRWCPRRPRRCPRERATPT